MEQLTISKIREGTVIDHIDAGKAPLVLKILGIDKGSKETVSLAMNVSSKKMGKKDIVKVEGKFLGEEELNKIALIAPGATINIIKDYKIEKKFKVTPPERLEGILKCPNRNCISNAEREPITPKFKIVKRSTLFAVCEYCGRRFSNFEDNLE